MNSDKGTDEGKTKRKDLAQSTRRKGGEESEKARQPTAEQQRAQRKAGEDLFRAYWDGWGGLAVGLDDFGWRPGGD
jgi:hypothetical protein